MAQGPTAAKAETPINRLELAEADSVDPEELTILEKQVVRKLDMSLVPLVTVMCKPRSLTP